MPRPVAASCAGADRSLVCGDDPSSARTSPGTGACRLVKALPRGSLILTMFSAIFRLKGDINDQGFINF
jgi:hypothetical protein